MHLKNLAGLILATSLSATGLIAQTATQDTKNAGSETKAAAVDTGRAVKTGTKKGYRKTKHGTKVAARDTKNGTEKAVDVTKHDSAVVGTKTARGTKKVAKAIVGDKTPTTTPHDPPKPQQ